MKLTFIDGAEGQSQQTITLSVLLELGADLRSKLNSLSGHSHTANSHVVRVDVTTCSTAIAVADAPAGAFELLSGARLVRVVNGVTTCFGR